MKEIIAKRHKNSYFFLLIFSVFSMVIGTNYMRVPMLRYIAIPALIALFLFAMMCIFLLVSPHGVIEQVDDTIIIWRGLRKTVINKDAILDVFPTPHPNKPNEIQKNVISIKVLVNGKEEILVCGDVADVDSAVRKLSGLIK